MSKRQPQRKSEDPFNCPYLTNGKQCPRCQAYERLPKWPLLQAVITSVMGVPHAGQQPLFKHSRITRAMTIFVTFYASVIATCVMVCQFSRAELMIKFVLVPAIFASVLVTSGMLRSMSMYLLHYATHDSFQRWSRCIGELSSITAMSLSFVEYLRKHLDKHHPLLTSAEDPDQQTIAALGFVPALPRDLYMKRLARVIVSPQLFMLHVRGRLASQFSSEHPAWRFALLAIIQLTPLAVALASCHFFATPVPLLAWAIAWLLPLTYGTYVSFIFFVLGLHRWFMQREPGMTASEFYLSKTGGRFFGDPLPRTNSPAMKYYLEWAWWWVRFVLLHLLIGRLFVMGMSDSQQHDVHHRFPRDGKHQWYDSIYSRDRLASSVLDGTPFWHTWGSVLTAIVLNFERMGKMPQLEQETVSDSNRADSLRTDM